MSYYEDERPRRHRSARDRRTRDDYDEDSYHKASGGGGDGGGASNRETRLTKKPRNDSFSSFEEVERDFPPGGGSGRKSSTRDGRRARSAGGGGRYESDQYGHRSNYDDDYNSSRRGGGRSDDRRRARGRGSYSDSSVSRSPPRRRQSVGEKALGALGIGAGGHGRDRSRSRQRQRRSSSSSSSSYPRSGRSGRKRTGKEDITQAAKAAFLAGATAAYHSRKDPGGWTGEKGKRVLTAAISAGGVDKLMDKKGGSHDTRNVIGSTLAGLVTTHLVNGPHSRSRSRGRDHRDGGRRGGRARSESRGGLKDLAGAGLITAAGKTIYDKVRSKSRGRRASSSSADSYDSRSPRHKSDKKKRSNSIAAYASKGLAALGLEDVADKINGQGARRSATFADDDSQHRRSRHGAPPPSQYGGGGYGDSRDVGQSRPGEHGAMIHRHANGPELGPHYFGDAETDSDSDLGDSSEDERARKKAVGSQLVSAGLATVATIHAAHSVYQSMEERDERKKAISQGDITEEHARRERNKAKLQDAVSVGIAALGIKTAVGEWKETKEKREAALELKEKVERQRQKREARRRDMQAMGMQQRFSGSAPTLSTWGGGHPYGGPVYANGNPYEAGHIPPAHYPYSPPPDHVSGAPLGPPPPGYAS